MKISVITSSVLLGFLIYHFVPVITEKDAALFELMKILLPSGLLGLGFASILAILMSTVDSMLMVGSATLTKDFYLVYHPQATEKQKLFFGRLFVLVFGLASLVVAAIYRDIAVLAVASLELILPLACALLGGLLWKKSSEPAAFYSILVGFIITLALLPITPNMAGFPALLISILIFIILSLRNSANNKIGDQSL